MSVSSPHTPLGAMADSVARTRSRCTDGRSQNVTTYTLRSLDRTSPLDLAKCDEDHIAGDLTDRQLPELGIDVLLDPRSHPEGVGGRPPRLVFREPFFGFDTETGVRLDNGSRLSSGKLHSRIYPVTEQFARLLSPRSGLSEPDLWKPSEGEKLLAISKMISEPP